jgi:hypothetical protein
MLVVLLLGACTETATGPDTRFAITRSQATGAWSESSVGLMLQLAPDGTFSVVHVPVAYLDGLTAGYAASHPFADGSGSWTLGTNPHEDSDVLDSVMLSFGQLAGSAVNGPLIPAPVQCASGAVVLQLAGLNLRRPGLSCK